MARLAQLIKDTKHPSIALGAIRDLLRDIWNLTSAPGPEQETGPADKDLRRAVHAAIKGVGQDVEGFRFNTIGVSDGIAMGTDGMSFSLQSRDLIADSIETVMSAQWYDANISIPGCDKNMPGCLIAMGRLNRPSLMVYGGTIRAGHLNGQKLDIISAFQSYGQFLTHSITDEQRQAIVRHSCPGAGAAA